MSSLSSSSSSKKNHHHHHHRHHPNATDENIDENHYFIQPNTTIHTHSHSPVAAEPTPIASTSSNVSYASSSSSATYSASAYQKKSRQQQEQHQQREQQEEEDDQSNSEIAIRSTKAESVPVSEAESYVSQAHTYYGTLGSSRGHYTANSSSAVNSAVRGDAATACCCCCCTDSCWKFCCGCTCCGHTTSRGLRKRRHCWSNCGAACVSTVIFGSAVAILAFVLTFLSSQLDETNILRSECQNCFTSNYYKNNNNSSNKNNNKTILIMFNQSSGFCFFNSSLLNISSSSQQQQQQKDKAKSDNEIVRSASFCGAAQCQPKFSEGLQFLQDVRPTPIIMMFTACCLSTALSICFNIVDLFVLDPVIQKCLVCLRWFLFGCCGRKFWEKYFSGNNSDSDNDFDSSENKNNNNRNDEDSDDDDDTEQDDENPTPTSNTSNNNTNNNAVQPAKKKKRRRISTPTLRGSTKLFFEIFKKEREGILGWEQASTEAQPLDERKLTSEQKIENENIVIMLVTYGVVHPVFYIIVYLFTIAHFLYLLSNMSSSKNVLHHPYSISDISFDTTFSSTNKVTSWQTYETFYLRFIGSGSALVTLVFYAQFIATFEALQIVEQRNGIARLDEFARRVAVPLGGAVTQFPYTEILHLVLLPLPVLPFFFTHFISGFLIFAPISILLIFLGIMTRRISSWILKKVAGVYFSGDFQSNKIFTNPFVNSTLRYLAEVVCLLVARIGGNFILLCLFQLSTSYAVMFYHEVAWQDVIRLDYEMRKTECWSNALRNDVEAWFVSASGLVLA